ncbi:MAG: NAD(P)-dependent alcohol dehydrogenase [Caldisphaera sp.]
MKAAILFKYNEDLIYQDYPKPVISEKDDVIIKIIGAGVCRTDIHEKNGEFKDKLKLPLIMGHENVGYIDNIEDNSLGLIKGIPVLVFPYVTSGYCLNCRKGNDMFCTEKPYMPGFDTDGGYAEYLKTKIRALLVLPTTLSREKLIKMAPLADAGITAYHAIKRISNHISPGSYVAIIGAGGGIGHIALQMLKSMTPAKIIALDKNDKGIKLAEKLGADFSVESGKDGGLKSIFEITKGVGADIVLDLVGEGDVTNIAIKMTKKQGILSIVGYGGSFTESTFDIINREITIMGNLTGTYSEFQEMVDLYLEGKLTIEGPVYQLRDANKALEDLSSNKYIGRAILVPP